MSAAATGNKFFFPPPPQSAEWLFSKNKWLLIGLGVGVWLGSVFVGSPERRRRLEIANAKAAVVQTHSLDASCFGRAGVSIVDRQLLLEELNPDTPAMTQSGPKGAYLFAPSSSDDDHASSSSSSSSSSQTTSRIPSQCSEVDVVVTQSSAGRCVLLGEGVGERVSRRVFDENLGSWEPVSRLKESKQRMPSDTTRNRARALEARLLGKLDEVKATLEPLLRDAAATGTDPAYAETMGSTKGAVLLMCVNAGNLDLLLNFVASARHKDIDVSNLVVFAADLEVERALKATKIRAFRHAALGDFKGDAARSYGDHQFVEMMWLKITCVFLVNSLGYDLLFQDADLVWWRSPWPYFASRPDVDSFWMDDGARTSRFAPHFPNTGFYLLRANKRTRLFNNQLLGGYAAVLAWQSHQALVSQVLAEAQALFGLTVHILHKELFPSGKQFHHNRPLFDRIHNHEFTPFCFHMCWTAGKDDKLKFLKQESLWFLPDRPKCHLDALIRHPDAILKNCLTLPAANNGSSSSST